MTVWQVEWAIGARDKHGTEIYANDIVANAIGAYVPVSAPSVYGCKPFNIVSRSGAQVFKPSECEIGGTIHDIQEG